ncbi:MAG: hypothetical protein ABIH72_02940 [archaeon]
MNQTNHKEFKISVTGHIIQRASEYISSLKQPIPHFGFVFGADWFAPILNNQIEHQSSNGKSILKMATILPPPILLDGHYASVEEVLDYAQTPNLFGEESRQIIIERALEEIVVFPLTEKRDEEVLELGYKTYAGSAWYFLESDKRKMLVFPSTKSLKHQKYS